MPVSLTQEARLAYLRHLVAEDSAEQRWIRTLREYAGGNHPLHLTERQEEFVGLRAKDRRHPYSHNLCRLVIDMVVERLSVAGFSPVEQGADDLAVAASAWWEANRMDAGEDELYEAALRDGVSFIVVSWDSRAGLPRWSINHAYDGTQGVKAHYDPDTGELLFASKRWQTVRLTERGDVSGRTRMNLYFPDRVEKYIAANSSALPGLGWSQYRDSEDEPWPVAWTTAQGEPLGVAATPFENPGGSEIADLIPIQDMLNKSDLDLIAAADHAGFRILWAAGVPPAIDPATGAERRLELSPGHILRMSDPAARIGAIEPADLTKIIAVCQYWIQSAAGVTRTPHYLFQALGAEQPSGESLRMQEIGLLGKIERKQRRFGNAWEDVIYLSAKLWNLHRPADKIKIARIQTQWAPATVKDELQHVQQAQLKATLGVPPEQLWAELGYSQEQIERFHEMRQEELARKETIGSFLLRAFERGEE